MIEDSLTRAVPTCNASIHSSERARRIDDRELETIAGANKSIDPGFYLLDVSVANNQINHPSLVSSLAMGAGGGAPRLVQLDEDHVGPGAPDELRHFTQLLAAG